MQLQPVIDSITDLPNDIAALKAIIVEQLKQGQHRQVQLDAAQEPNFRQLVEAQTPLFANQTLEIVNKDPALVIEFLAKCKAAK